MSSVTISGDTSGSIILQAPSVAGSTTLTLPTTSGTVLTSANAFSAGTGPAFSAYVSSSVSLTNNTYTKLPFNAKEFDTNNNFDSTTNYRFTPTVAGYYQLSFAWSLFGGSSSTETVISVYKNGTVFKYLTDISATNIWGINGAALVYANGTTDYFEIYVYNNSSRGALGGIQYCFFQGFLARSA